MVITKVIEVVYIIIAEGNILGKFRPSYLIFGAGFWSSGCDDSLDARDKRVVVFSELGFGGFRNACHCSQGTALQKIQKEKTNIKQEKKAKAKRY